VVASACREPKMRGCGTGGVKTMPESGNLGGRCADLNAFFVAPWRACGIPARDGYGLRPAPSAMGYKELGGLEHRPRGHVARHCGQGRAAVPDVPQR
jgi:transglutaminase-like putative cysteine protease